MGRWTSAMRPRKQRKKDHCPSSILVCFDLIRQTGDLRK